MSAPRLERPDSLVLLQRANASGPWTVGEHRRPRRVATFANIRCAPRVDGDPRRRNVLAGTRPRRRLARHASDDLALVGQDRDPRPEVGRPAVEVIVRADFPDVA